VLDPALKTIVHIPNVNARESTSDKIKEAEWIMDALGEWDSEDPATGFHLIRRPDGSVLKVANLVEDGAKRDKVITALKDPAHGGDREHVDIILALGMAKEGFDWIWCEHALTVGYRSSLTEVVQIIGRATRDAPGKALARFTNLIAAPTAVQDQVTDALNDTLKAISASLLMEQVLAPRWDFTPRNSGPKEGFDYGPDGYKEGQTNLGYSEKEGRVHVEIKGLVQPTTGEAKRICEQDLNEVIAKFVQDKSTVERGMFDDETIPEELTQLRMGKIVRESYPNLNDDDHEAIRQHAVAAMNLTQQAKQVTLAARGGVGEAVQGNTAFIDGVRKFALSVRELDIDLIDRINPFGTAYAVLARTMDEPMLKQVQAAINAKKVNIPYEDALDLTKRAVRFKKEHGRAPNITSADAWEKKMAEGVVALARYRAQQIATDG